MSENIFLIIAGVVIFIVGVAKQSGKVTLSNFGINFGSTNTQTIYVASAPDTAAKKPKHDWIGLAIAALGFFTALVGLLKKG
ncbi:MAG: hypothetical protein ACLPSF_00040 [Methylocella sp.]